MVVLEAYIGSVKYQEPQKGRLFEGLNPKRYLKHLKTNRQACFSSSEEAEVGQKAALGTADFHRFFRLANRLVFGIFRLFLGF